MKSTRLMQTLELKRNGYAAAIAAYPKDLSNNNVFDLYAKQSGIDEIIQDLQENNGIEPAKDIVVPNTVMEDLIKGMEK